MNTESLGSLVTGILWIPCSESALLNPFVRRAKRPDGTKTDETQVLTGEGPARFS